jgi:hypothetical protein
VRLILLSLGLAIVVGLLAGGTLREFPTIGIRWGWLALAGVLLQFSPAHGTGGVLLLLLSFAFLFVFAVANLRSPGFILILAGLCLNLLVIAANQGMPVTREALVRSGQADTLTDLVQHGGSKHHLAGDDSVLLPLGDVIAVGWPVDQVVSVGDICVHLGVGWFIVVAMQSRRRPSTAPHTPERTRIA